MRGLLAALVVLAAATGASAQDAAKDCVYDPDSLRLKADRQVRMTESTWKTDPTLPMGTKAYSGTFEGSEFSLRSDICDFYGVEFVVRTPERSRDDPYEVVRRLSRKVWLPFELDRLTASQRRRLAERGELVVEDDEGRLQVAREKKGAFTIVTVSYGLRH